MTKRLSDHYKHGHTRYKGQWRKNFAIRTEIYQRWLRSSCPGIKKIIWRLYLYVCLIETSSTHEFYTSINILSVAVVVIMIKLYPKPHTWPNVSKQVYVYIMYIKVVELFIIVCLLFITSASFPYTIIKWFTI